MGVPRRRQRAIVQPLILAMQLISLSILCVVGGRNSSAGFLSAGFWTLFMIACPVVLACTTLGVRAFRRVSDIDFKRITMPSCRFPEALFSSRDSSRSEASHALRRSPWRDASGRTGRRYPCEQTHRRGVLLISSKSNRARKKNAADPLGVRRANEEL
jgi:hypothetical protein